MPISRGKPISAKIEVVITESITVSESVTRVFTGEREISEIINVSESLSKTKIVPTPPKFKATTTEGKGKVILTEGEGRIELTESEGKAILTEGEGSLKSTTPEEKTEYA